MMSVCPSSRETVPGSRLFGSGRLVGHEGTACQGPNVQGEQPFTVTVADGPRLVGALGVPEQAGSPRAGLVLCHPHPLHGGDMDNPVIVRAAEVARGRGLLTLRFNFRGAGGSTGVHTGGQREQDDVGACLDRLSAELATPGAPMALLGYSFGAWVAAHVFAARPDLAALCLVAPPLRMLDFPLPEPSGGRVAVGTRAARRPVEGEGWSGRALLALCGTRDPYCSVADLTGWAGGVGALTEIVEDADHIFFGKLYPLGEAVGRWADQWLAGSEPRARETSGGAGAG
jgi:alpha/beta superfamily hydrolase